MSLLKRYLCLSIILLIAGTFYYPGKEGPFLLDDLSSIAGNPNIRVTPYTGATFLDAAYSWNRITQSGEMIPTRPLSYMSFALNFYFADHIISAFKLTNIVLHLITGALVFFLTRKILQLSWPEGPDISRDGLAMLICFTWLMHPLFVSTVLYITQRMTILSGLFTLLTTLAFINYRLEFMNGKPVFWRAFFLLSLGTALAFFSKENGILIPVYCLVLECIFFRFRFNETLPRYQIQLFRICLLAPCIIIISYLAYSYFSQLENPPVTRTFSVNERLMTEFRVLWQYVSYLTLIDPQGISVYHDGIRPSRSMLSPVSTPLSALAWGLILLLAICCTLKQKARLLSLGILWFLTGHLLESTVLPLELAFEHRNYIPGLSVIILAVSTLYFSASRVMKKQPAALAAVSVILLVGMPVTLSGRVSAWKDNRTLVMDSYARAPDSPRLLMHMFSYSRQDGDSDKAQFYINRAKKLQPGEAGYSLHQIALICEQDGPIPGQLTAEAIRLLESGTPGAMTFNAFNGVIKQCNRERYDTTLIPVYQATSRSPFRKLSTNGLVMQARAELRQGREAIYHALIERAQQSVKTIELKKELSDK